EPPLTTMEAAKPVPASGGVRVDTGVYEGGEIPMYYDSMICKLIVCGADRLDAIAKMREALNAFVIRGISSNIPFQAALLAHPKFVSGDFNTGFIAEQYPKGYSVASVQASDPGFLLALAVALNRRVLERSAGITGQLPGHEMRIGTDFVVVQTDTTGRRTKTPASVRREGALFAVEVAGKPYAITFEGHLRDVAVQPGQTVRAGERLAVIEAMKMENILVAVRDGVVAKVLASKGESLAVDQVIMEFERAEAEA
ncbi:MAG: biotin/lipoyl-containing protein, partial [Rhizobacter sp.]